MQIRPTTTAFHAVSGVPFYAHRKQWIAERLAELAHVFAIEVCAYAIMDNHAHYVLKINADKARHWSEQEITERWQRLFSLPVLVQQYRSGQCTTPVQQDIAQKVIETWRERLMDISWMMRCLNEHIARKANAEDKCTGRFWGWFLRPAKPAYITSL